MQLAVADRHRCLLVRLAALSSGVQNRCSAARTTRGKHSDRAAFERGIYRTFGWWRGSAPSIWHVLCVSVSAQTSGPPLLSVGGVLGRPGALPGPGRALRGGSAGWAFLTASVLPAGIWIHTARDVRVLSPGVSGCGAASDPRCRLHEPARTGMWPGSPPRLTAAGQPLPAPSPSRPEGPVTSSTNAAPGHGVGETSAQRCRRSRAARRCARCGVSVPSAGGVVESRRVRGWAWGRVGQHFSR